MQIRENREGALREEKPFASGMNFYKLFWIFFLGCIAGVIVETLWCLSVSYTHLDVYKRQDYGRKRDCSK